MNYQLLQGDNRQVLKTLPDQSVHCIVTSPPYFGLRDYGVDRQIGLEETPAAYVAELVTVFRECWRVLRDDGTLWLNLGDSYNSGSSGGLGGSTITGGQRNQAASNRSGRGYIDGLKPKCLIGIPWRVAFALVDDGWILRSDIIWAKPNPMPESVTDRPTKAHEYIFLLTKSQRYYYDSEAVKEPAVKGAAGSEFHTGKSGIHQLGRSSTKPRSKADSFKREGSKREQTIPGQGYGTHRPDREESDYDLETRNRRSVWTVPTSPYPGAHFATFPPALIEPCILAGTSEHGCCNQCGAPWERVTKKGFTAHDGETQSAYDKGSTANRLALLRQAARARGEEYSSAKETIGWQPTCTCNADIVPATVLDPFNGSGTTGAVACAHNRNYIGIDLSAAYIELAHDRIREAINASGRAYVAPVCKIDDFADMPLFA